MRNLFFLCSFLCVHHGSFAAHGNDHDAFEAYLQAPFYADSGGARTVTLHLPPLCRASAWPGNSICWGTTAACCVTGAASTGLPGPH